MRIIVEGPDGAGKTSFIKGLRDRHPGFELAQRFATSEDGPKPDMKAMVEKDLDAPFDDPGRVVIYDRHPLVSELIYAPALGRSLAYGFDDPNWLTDALTRWRMKKHVIVYCMPRREAVIRNVHKTHAIPTDHMHGVRRMIGHIYDLYLARAALDRSNPQCLVIHHAYDNQENWPMVVNFFQAWNERMMKWRAMHGVD